MKEKKEQILDAAEMAFAEHGFKETSIRQIAQIAGVNASMLNYYFHSKEKLLEEVLERKIMYFNLLWNELSPQQDSAINKIMALVKLSIELMSSNTMFFRFIIREQLISSSAESAVIIKNYLEQRLNTIKYILLYGINRKELKPVDVEFTCMSIYGTYISCLLNPDFLKDSLNQNFHVRLAGFFEQHLNFLVINKPMP